MKKIFKNTLLFAAVCTLATGFAACSSDDDDNDDSIYSDRSYGQKAIEDCDQVVKEFTAASNRIPSTGLSAEQEDYLRKTLENLVDNVIIPTYTKLADDTEDLESTLRGLTVNTITQDQINKACDDFKKARESWERSEAFLMGAASDFNIDPTIDSWPLNRTLLLNYFNNGMNEEMLEDATILGFHALEFILFRDGKPRQVSEFKGYDTYKNFEKVSGEKELAYAQTICTLLKQRTYQLQVAWEGETDADRAAVVKAAALDITTEKGLSYRDNLVMAGIGNNSTFTSLKDAISQVLSDDEGSCVGIANEVGTAKIANPFSAGDISYVESPYSYNSITDFQDNIRSIRNVWLGSTDGQAAEYSFHGFFAATGNSAVNDKVEGAYQSAINSIGSMPSPFVKYCSTIWNIAFEDDEDWETEE